MPNDWLQTAQQLADLMRELRACRPERVAHNRSKVRRFLESHGCTVMPWANAYVSRRSRYIRDAAAAYDQETPGEIAQPEGEGALQRNGDGDCPASKIIRLGLELPPPPAEGRG